MKLIIYSLLSQRSKNWYNKKVYKVNNRKQPSRLIIKLNQYNKIQINSISNNVKPKTQKANVFSWRKNLETRKRGRRKKRNVVADLYNILFYD